MSDFYDDDDGDITDLYEPDEFEEAISNCCGHFDPDGYFVCGAVGSEDCEFECPLNRDLGMTAEQIENRDIEEMLAEDRAIKAERAAACEPWFDDSTFDIVGKP